MKKVLGCITFGAAICCLCLGVYLLATPGKKKKAEEPEPTDDTVEEE